MFGNYSDFLSGKVSRYVYMLLLNINRAWDLNPADPAAYNF